MMNPVTWVCSECGSEDVSIQAEAIWSVEQQRWVLDEGSLDREYCVDCGDQTDLEEKEVE